MTKSKPSYKVETEQDMTAKPAAIPILVRTMRITDLLSIHKMYDSLFPESKRFTAVQIFGTKAINLHRALGQVALILSCNRFFRSLLQKIYLGAAFFSMVAAEANNNNVVGLAFLRGTRGTNSRRKRTLEIFVAAAYQGMKVGSRLVAELINYASGNSISHINLEVYSNNIRAISLY